MKWREGYLDMILVPLGLLLCILYHIWLLRKVRSHPLSTDIGISSAIQRRWVIAMIKENGKKNMLAVQTIRNAIMASTVMATTSILLSTGLAAIISSTYHVEKPLEDSLYGAHGEFILALKFAALLLILLLTFLCYTLSIRIMSQVSFLINIPFGDDDVGDVRRGEGSPPAVTTAEYVCDLFDKGFLLHIVGNRLLYAAVPLLLWIFGPCLVLLCYVIMVPVMYVTDINVPCAVAMEEKGDFGKKTNQEKIFICMGV